MTLLDKIALGIAAWILAGGLVAAWFWAARLGTPDDHEIDEHGTWKP